MKTTRRQFIKLSSTAAGGFALSIRSTTVLAEKSVKPLRILILGGTGFTGPYQVRYALSRGHKVTTFNRGKTHPGELPKEAEKWFPGKTLVIRPGLIVGPRDETDRFTYWPVRIDRGGDVLVPINASA